MLNSLPGRGHTHTHTGGKMVWPFSSKGPSGFSSSSTAEEVTEGIDGTGLTAVVTGATSGIGRETARVLALRGVHVVMAARDPAAGRAVRDELLQQMPAAEIDVLQLDLGSMASIRRFAAEFHALNLPLNILINNAGVLSKGFKLSTDGIETHFATNHLGHFLLTNLLLDNMKNTSRRTNIEGRIINVSSSDHQVTYREGILFDTVANETKYSRIYAYGQSKLANILHVNKLAKHLKEEGVNITANSLHPGLIITNIFRHYPFIGAIISFAGKPMTKSVQQGAATTCYVALHPQVQGVSGKYFVDSNVAKTSSQATDEELANKLWDFSMALVDEQKNPASTN